MTDSHSPPTGVQLTTKIFPLAFLLLFFKTNVSVDGEAKVEPWGTHFYDLAPGKHSIRVGFRYFFSKNMGENAIDVEVALGQTVKVKYRSPLIVFSAGSIIVE